MALVRLVFKPGAFGRKKDWYINKIGTDGQCDVGRAACTRTVFAGTGYIESRFQSLSWENWT